MRKNCQKYLAVSRKKCTPMLRNSRQVMLANTAVAMMWLTLSLKK